MSPMTLLVVAGGIVCFWTMLSVLTGERSRRVRQIEAEAAPPEPSPAAIPVASSPKHAIKKLGAKPAPPAPAKAK